MSIKCNLQRVLPSISHLMKCFLEHHSQTKMFSPLRDRDLREFLSKLKHVRRKSCLQNRKIISILIQNNQLLPSYFCIRVNSACLLSSPFLSVNYLQYLVPNNICLEICYPSEEFLQVFSSLPINLGSSNCFFIFLDEQIVFFF